jgi:hypothetical protein
MNKHEPMAYFASIKDGEIQPIKDYIDLAVQYDEIEYLESALSILQKYVKAQHAKGKIKREVSK